MFDLKTSVLPSINPPSHFPSSMISLEAVTSPFPCWIFLLSFLCVYTNLTLKTCTCESPLNHPKELLGLSRKDKLNWGYWNPSFILNKCWRFGALLSLKFSMQTTLKTATESQGEGLGVLRLCCHLIHVLHYHHHCCHREDGPENSTGHCSKPQCTAKMVSL